MLRAFIILVVLVTAAVASAAGLPELRAGVATGSARLTEARAQRELLQRSLEQVARRIEQLKAERGSRGPLFSGTELDDLLKQSQQLSEQLHLLLGQERVAEEGLRSGQGDLVAALAAEIASTERAWDRAGSSDERRTLIARLRQLRAEREALRRQLPMAAQMPAGLERPTDDPEELLERADAWRDGEDKVRREERALAARIEELRRERELERRMSDFMNEGSLFDEHDRRISVTRTTRTATTPASAPASAEESAPQTQADSRGTAEAPPPGAGDSMTAPGQPPDSYTGGTPTAGQPGTQPTAPPPAPSAPSTPIVVEQTRTGVSLAPPDRHGLFAPPSGDESLEELEARQAKLRAVADEFHRKAEDAARRARELR